MLYKPGDVIKVYNGFIDNLDLLIVGIANNGSWKLDCYLALSPSGTIWYFWEDEILGYA